MRHEVGYCPHEAAFGVIQWDDDGEQNILLCALCDIMICTLPDYIEFIGEKNNG